MSPSKRKRQHSDESPDEVLKLARKLFNNGPPSQAVNSFFFSPPGTVSFQSNHLADGNSKQDIYTRLGQGENTC